VFIGRDERAKGAGVLVAAWRASSRDPAPAALVLVGARPEILQVGADGAVCPQHTPIRVVESQSPEEVRNFLQSADVLVVPSIPTPSFLEPWGLVCNEAMHLGLPVIATDAVGAAAGGLVRHERNGLVVPAGDAPALAQAIRRLRDDAPLRRRLGDAARRDAAAYTHRAWAAGFHAALRSLDTKEPC
jgi:glycosyltransferase involved in cell wall biosynthesis